MIGEIRARTIRNFMKISQENGFVNKEGHVLDLFFDQYIPHEEEIKSRKSTKNKKCSKHGDSHDKDHVEPGVQTDIQNIIPTDQNNAELNQAIELNLIMETILKQRNESLELIFLVLGLPKPTVIQDEEMNDQPDEEVPNMDTIRNRYKKLLELVEARDKVLESFRQAVLKFNEKTDTEETNPYSQ